VLGSAVLEVGMRGRLDATNVVDAPAATAVTRIALDHDASLGDTLSEIAQERACIAKAGCPMVLGAMDGHARAEVRRVALARGANPVEHAEDTPWGSAERKTSLQGRHQQDNARTAADLCFHVARRLARLRQERVVDAVGQAEWPGRMENIRRYLQFPERVTMCEAYS